MYNPYGRDWIATFTWFGLALIALTFALLGSILSVAGGIVMVTGNPVAMIFTPLGVGASVLLWVWVGYCVREMLES